jgi:hypothetical protein
VVDDHLVAPFGQLEDGRPADTGRTASDDGHLYGHDTCPDSTGSTAGMEVGARGNSASRIPTR